MRHLAVICSLLLFLQPAAYAQEHEGLSFLLGSDLQHFDYREYSDQGKLLDLENGFLPGILLGVEHNQHPWKIAGQLSHHAGDTTYTGQTNGGAPITTTTRQQIINIELRAGYRLHQIQQIKPALYFGAANHSWRRDIQPTYTSSGMPVRGLLETYRWWQAFGGMQISNSQAASFDWGLDARLTRIIDPKVEVDYAGLYDNAKLNLGERWGFRLSLPMSYSMRYSTSLSLEPYLEKYSLGRSSSVPLIRQGNIVGTVYEPDSTGSNYGVTINIHMHF